MVIGGTVSPVSSVGRVPDLQAGGCGFESCIRHTFSSLVYFRVKSIPGLSSNCLSEQVLCF